MNQATKDALQALKTWCTTHAATIRRLPYGECMVEVEVGAVAQEKVQFEDFNSLTSDVTVKDQESFVG